MNYASRIKMLKCTCLSLCLMSLLGCSTLQHPTEPEIKIVTKIEREIPPPVLVQPCTMPAYSPIVTESDIVNSRQDWISSWLECNALHQRLIDWNAGKIPASPE